MRQLRIAYLPPSLRPAGAERQMLALAEGLPRERFRVSIIAMSGSGPDDQRAITAGARLRLVGTPPRPGAGQLERLKGQASKSAGYLRIARSERYDIIDAWLYPVDVMAALGRGLTRTPIIVTGRRNLREFDHPMSRLDRLLTTAANRLTDAVVANSDAVAEDTLQHERLDPARLHVIRNGVQTTEPLAPADVATARRDLGACDDDIVIGSLGNYHPVKRLDVLIDAFGALVLMGHRVRLVCLGEGPLRPALQRRIEELGLAERVVLYGTVSDPQRFLGAFDILVQASQSEGLPNALLEGAAAGRAIVATDVGGTREIVVDGDTGILVPPNAPADLAVALGRVAADARLRDRLGRAARQRSMTAFGMERFVAEFGALYEQLAISKGLV